MQTKSKKQSESLSESVPASPYRMGNWTVTMLKEELRVRQLPISGKKAELIDRLESNSPVKLAAAPNTKVMKDTEQLAKISPIKLSPSKISPAKMSPAVTKVQEQGARGRSRSSSPSPAQRMLTRSRSTSLSRGTLLTWSRAPLSVIVNFFLSQVEMVRNNGFMLSAFAAFVIAFTVSCYMNDNLRSFVRENSLKLQPFFLMCLDGFMSDLGFKRSQLRLYIARASRFMYDCSSGNIERNSVTGRLRCSAAPLNFLGLPGRLVQLEKEHFVSWTVGAILASFLVYSIAGKCRTALGSGLQVNSSFRKSMAFCNRNVAFIAAIAPFEVAGLISGLSGFNGNKFATLMVIKAFISVPLQFAARIFFAKYQQAFEAQFNRLPAFAVNSIISVFNFFDASVYVLYARQALNATLYLFLCAAAVQVIANARVYKRNLRA